jgi:hypothetical protein
MTNEVEKWWTIRGVYHRIRPVDPGDVGWRWRLTCVVHSEGCLRSEEAAGFNPRATI